VWSSKNWTQSGCLKTNCKCLGPINTCCNTCLCTDKASQQPAIRRYQMHTIKSRIASLYYFFASPTSFFHNQCLSLFTLLQLEPLQSSPARAFLFLQQMLGYHLLIFLYHKDPVEAYRKIPSGPWVDLRLYFPMGRSRSY
jgi:hypothetical protein